jgi:hypothetical protein
MAIFHACTKPISRASGRSAVAAAAYRSGTELTDERTGLTHDFTRKGGVESANTFLPDGSTVDREHLWNAAEGAEKRKDARTAREWEVALPAELSKEQRQELAHGFARELASRYGVAADCAIHAPGKEGDQRNYHAHILTTTRLVISSDENGQVQMGDKSDLELSDKKLAERGLCTGADQIKSLREEWANRCNASLERAQVTERVDHRSHAERGIETEPGRHLGPAGTALQRELVAVRQALAEAREALMGFAADIASTAKGAVRGIIERFRETNPGVRGGEPTQGGILAGLREQRQDRGVAQDQASTAQSAAQTYDQEQTA